MELGSTFSRGPGLSWGILASLGRVRHTFDTLSTQLEQNFHVLRHTFDTIRQYSMYVVRRNRTIWGCTDMAATSERVSLGIGDVEIGETVRIVGTSISGEIVKKYSQKIEIIADGRTYEVYPSEVEMTDDAKALAMFATRFGRAWDEDRDGAGCLDPFYEELAGGRGMVSLGTVRIGEYFAEVWQSDVNRGWYVTYGMNDVCRDSVFVGDKQKAITFAVKYLTRD